MDFHANNLDGAYTTLSNLNALASGEGTTMETKLKNVISNLQLHWKGNDATVHINNLMDVCSGLDDIINSVMMVAHNVSIPIVNAQTIRNSNGGMGDIGTVIPYNQQAPLTFQKLESTTEYYVDPVGAPKDYFELCDVCTTFTGFCNKFSQYREELMNNWISGTNRDKAVSDFTEFESNVLSYTKKINEAKDNLGTATSNLKQI